jgi:hypothetical protein
MPSSFPLQVVKQESFTFYNSLEKTPDQYDARTATKVTATITDHRA